MQADDRRGAQQLVEPDEPDAVGARRGLVGVGVGDEDGRAERAEHPGDDPADGAVPDEPHGGAVELEAGLVVGVEVAAPGPVAQLAVGHRDAAQRGERHAHRVLGRGRRVPAGRLGHGHAGPVGRGEVDVDRAAAGHRDHLEVRDRVEHPGRERRHLRQADARAVEGGDEVVLGARRLLHPRALGPDRAEGLVRPARREVGDVEVTHVGFGPQGLVEQGGEDELVPGSEYARHRAAPVGTPSSRARISRWAAGTPSATRVVSSMASGFGG